ncbi:MAG TPA: TolC family protein [Polyangia bacterium]|nr:TolC family protein [Polyangia bacterium]
MRALRQLAPLALLLTSTIARAQVPPPVQPSDDARPTSKVTWAEALDRAFRSSPTIVVAIQEIERADALVRQARGAWLPTLTGNGSLTRINAARYFGTTETTPQNSWNANLALNVPLLSPLAWGNDAHAGDNRDVAKATAADVRRQLAVSVGRAYLTVLLQHREVEVAIRARDTAAAHYDYAHTRLTTGLGNGVDDARAEQELRTNEAQVKNAETALVRAQSALAILLSAEDLVDVADEVALGAAPSLDAAVEDARSHRSDVRALQAKRTASEHLRRDDWLYYAPTLLGQAEAFRETASPLQPGSGWQASLVLAVPIFDGGVRYGVQRERRAEDEEARVQLEGLLHQVSVEVRSSFAIVRNADESLKSSRAAVVAALSAATLADKSYKAGASTNIEVIDAERQARDAESQAALAEDAARQARLDLLVATGAFP